MPLTPRCDSKRLRLLAVVALCGAWLAGCSSEEAPGSASSDAPPSAQVAEAHVVPERPVGSIEAIALEIGAGVDADGRVSVSMERFRRADTVHASLVTVGDAPASMLKVQWRDANGLEVAVDERAIQTTGPAVHTFSRAVEGGWLPGRYEVEMHLNGESAGVRPFEVR